MLKKHHSILKIQNVSAIFSNQFRRFSETHAPKYEYEEYEWSGGHAPVQPRLYRIYHKEAMDKVMSYPYSEKCGIKERLQLYQNSNPVSTKPIFGQNFNLPRPIFTFGASGKKIWSTPFFFGRFDPHPGRNDSLLFDVFFGVLCIVFIYYLVQNTCIYGPMRQKRVAERDPSYYDVPIKRLPDK